MKSDGFMMDSITNQNDNTGVIHEMPTGFCRGLFCCCPIDLIHKSQNAPVPYPTMLYSEQKCAHFCSEWSIVGYGIGAFWDLWKWSIAIFRSLLWIMHTYISGLFPRHWIDCRDARDALQWRHNEHDGVSNHQPHGCFLKRLFRHRSKKTSKLRVTGLCAGNSPVTGEFPAQRASKAENVSIWWRHHYEILENLCAWFLGQLVKSC